jgi:hypothetical protein
MRRNVLKWPIRCGKSRTDQSATWEYIDRPIRWEILRPYQLEVARSMHPNAGYLIPKNTLPTITAPMVVFYYGWIQNFANGNFSL